MPGTPNKPRDLGKVKDVVTRLVSACGGIKSAAAVDGVRVGKTEMGRYTCDDQFKGSHFMPVDVVLALEAHCGAPIVTEYLAAEAGAVLLRIPREVTGKWLAEITRLTDERADVVRAICEALDGDGAIDAREAGRAIKEIDEDMAVLASLRARLADIRDLGAA